MEPDMGELAKPHPHLDLAGRYGNVGRTDTNNSLFAVSRLLPSQAEMSDGVQAKSRHIPAAILNFLIYFAST
jgi:hypothetical protein